MKYMTIGSAGADLYAKEGGTIQPGDTLVVSTGDMAPELGAGNCALVVPRSGLAAKFGVTVLNSPGLIDPDYTGEIQVILINHGKEPFTFSAGDRIAQLVGVPFVRIWGVQTGGTVRGEDGLGSTGK